MYATFDIPKPKKGMRRARTPTTVQMEAAECGAAALSIILGYYGRHVPLAELRIPCGVSRDGCDAYNLVEAAKDYGLTAEGYALTLEDLSKLPRPCILHWDYNHFVVLEGMSASGKVHVNDPAVGPRSYSLEEFAKHFSGTALTFVPNENFQKGGHPPSLWEAIKRRAKQVGTAPLRYLIYCQIALVLLGLAPPAFRRILIDNILGRFMVHWKWPFLITMGITTLITVAYTLSRQNVLRRFRTKMSLVYSSDFLWHVVRLPASFFSQRFGGEVIGRMKLNDRISGLLTGQVATTVVDILFIAFYGLVMIHYDLLITVIGISAATLQLGTLWWVSRKRTDAHARLRQEEARTVGISIDTLQNMESLKACGSENYLLSRVVGNYARTINTTQQIGKTDVVLSSVAAAMEQLSSVLLLAVGCWQVIHGSLTVGMLSAFQMLMQRFVSPFSRLLSFGTVIQELKMDLQRLDDVMANKIDPIAFTQPEVPPREAPKLQGHIELRNITFGYAPHDDPLFTQLNLELKPKETVALVGTTGSGKSTIAALVCGLYKPSSGEILLDGKPQVQYPRETIRQSLGWVDQKILLFSGTIRDNLTMWDYTIPDDALERAARDACILEEITTRPGTWEAKVAEGGANFSAGQRQRLEIARALVMDPTVLVLDEATSALDPQTEEKIVRNLQARNCTCLVIAHRLSTVKRCNRIVVLQAGKVVQSGTHDELKQQQGYYQELVKRDI